MKTHILKTLLVSILLTTTTHAQTTREDFEARAARETVAYAIARTPEDREWALRRMWANLLYIQLLFSPTLVPVPVITPIPQPNPRELRTGHRLAGCKPRK